MTVACSIYGLGLQPNVPILGLGGLGAPAQVDVSLTLGSLPQEPPGWVEFFVDEEHEHGEAVVRVSRSEDGAYHRIRYADGTIIVLEARGRAMWAVGPASSTVEDTATYLLGPVFGYLLRLRGITSLHASAVVLGDVAVAFAGPSEAGKSSMAAAFARCGHAVLADDVVSLVEGPDFFAVQPAYPRLRLWPDTAESLFGEGDALPRIIPSWEKRYLDLNRPDMRFARESAPLGAIYLLGERGPADSPPRFEVLEARTALMALLPETCAARLLDRAMRAREFEALSRLVESVRVCRLHVPAELRSLEATVAAVERDVRRQPRP